MRVHVVALVVLTLLAPAATGAPAQTPDEDQPSRTVDVRGDEEGVTIVLEASEESGQDPVEVSFSFAHGTLSVIHGDTEGNGQELRAALLALLEYRDGDGNGSYDPGEPVHSAWGIGQERSQARETNGTAVWGTPIVANASLDGAEGKRVVVPAQVGDGATLTLQMRAFGERVQTSNGTLSPTSVGVELSIENYPYDRNDTALALLGSAATQADPGFGGGQTPSAEGIVASHRTDGASTDLALRWSGNATVDGERAPVDTSWLGAVADAGGGAGQARDAENGTDRSPVANGTERSFVVSYPRGERITHRQEAEVVLASAESENVSPFGKAAAAIVALGGAALLGRRELA